MAPMRTYTGCAVRRARLERQLRGLEWSQTWLATQCGCSQGAITRLEAGGYHNRKGEWVRYVPPERVLRAIAAALEVPYSSLIAPR